MVNNKFDPLKYGAIEEEINPSKMEITSINQKQPNEIYNIPNLMTQQIIKGAENPDVISKFISSAVPFAVAPELRVPEFIASKIPSIISGSANLLGRIGTGSIISGLEGALHPQNQDRTTQFKESASESLPWMVGAEALPLPFKGLSAAAEFIHPQGFTNETVKNISNIYNSLKQKTSDLYNSVKDQYGENNMTFSPESYLGFKKNKIKKKYLTPEVKKSYDDFIEDPIFANAHQLQSQLFKDSSSLSGNTNKLNSYQTMIKARKLVTDKISKFLEQDPIALNKYKTATDITRDEIAPLKSNDTLKKISEGRIRDISPEKFMNSIKTAVENKQVPENHILNKYLSELTHRIHRGKAIGDIGTLGGGAALGEALLPGIGGGAAGAGLAKFLSPNMVGLIQNPYMNQLIEKLSSPANLLKRSAIGYNINE